MMPRLPGLSVVVPVRDEEENVLALADEIDAALASLPEWECIWVDDASTDGTALLLRSVVSARPRHRLLRFDEHRGQTAALFAGWKAARSEFVASQDGDRQNEPADLPRLLEVAVRDRLDMVNGVRARRHDSWVRLASSRIATWFRDWVTGDRISDVGCSTRVLRRTFATSLPQFRNMHRFLPTLVRLAGGRIGEEPVGHRPRSAGRTKYGIGNRLWVGIADSLAVRWMTRRTFRLDAVEWRPPASLAPETRDPAPLRTSHAHSVAAVPPAIPPSAPRA